MKTLFSMLYGMVAITALTLGCFTFQLSAFIGTLFATMAVAFVVMAIIIATQE